MVISFELVSEIILLFGQIIFGLYVLIMSKKSQAGFAFATICFSLSLWSIGGYMLNNVTSITEVEYWGKYIFLGPVLLAYSFLYFSFVFPNGRVKNVLNGILFALTMIFLVLVPTPFILKSGGLSIHGPIPTWGIAYPAFGVYFVVFFVWGVFNLFGKYQRALGRGKNQVRYVLLGLFLTFFFGIIFNLVFPSLKISNYVNLGPFFTLTTIGFTAYAITKHRLMDISVIISRTVAEVITILIQGAIYLLLVWLYTGQISGKIDSFFLTFTILYGILVGQTHQKMRLFMQTTSDKLFLRGHYDYYKELAEASLRVVQKLSLPDILKVLYDTFNNVVEISNPRIFLPENFSDPERPAHRFLVYDQEKFRPKAEGETIAADSKTVEDLVKSRQPIINIHDQHNELIMPCLLEDRLIAIFALGQKLSEEHYTDEDLHLLETLASQVAVALDHTRSYEKIKVELESAEKQLDRSQRLAALGTLTAGVTHEIRNPLTVIRSETERLPNKERDLEYLTQFRDLILKHIDRISGIVQRMLAMAKERVHEEKEIDLTELLNNSLQLINFKAVTVQKDLSLVPVIKGDQVELEEVFVNLFQNATDAMPNGGTLTVRTYIDDGRAVVEISDTGKGIPSEIQEKIFDPFFSTRHEGVGLGLSIAYRIIREHGGDIKLTSEVGKGTTFKIIF
jgi:signal transduction histidine kinase